MTGLAEDAIRPARLGKHVQLMSTDSIALYEELTGVRLGYDPGSLQAALRPSDRVECTLPPPRLPPGAAPAPAHALFGADRVGDPRRESLPDVHLSTVQAEDVRLCVRCRQRPRRSPEIAQCDECDRATDDLLARRRASGAGGPQMMPR